MKSYVIIINGSANAGKDTFVELFENICSNNEVVYEFSTINKVKKAVRELVPGPIKNDKYRKFLSDIKKLWVEYNEGPCWATFEYIEHVLQAEYVVTNYNSVFIFIHCREPEEIKKLVSHVNYRFESVCKTLLIHKPNIAIPNNDSDKNVEDYNYDFIIDNIGTIEDLKECAVEFKTKLHQSNISFGIDIDDCIVTTIPSIISLIGRFYNEVFSVHRIKRYDIYKCLHIDKEVERAAIELVIEDSDNLKFIDGAVETILWLASKGTRIHFITGRDERFKNVTCKLLNKLGIFYSLSFCDGEEGKTKADVINEYDIKFLVEDRGSIVEDVYRNTRASCFLFDKPWNQHVRANSGILRVGNWGEIREHMEKLIV